MKRFHIQMAITSAIILFLVLLGFAAEDIRIGATVGHLQFYSALGILCVPASFYVRKIGDRYVADAILTAFWAALFFTLLHFLVAVCARLSAICPLADAWLYAADRTMGFDVPRIRAWAITNWFGRFEQIVYPLGIPYIEAALFLPLFTGHLRNTKLFIVSNLVSFAIGLPLFVLFPAVGPWYAAHSPASYWQLSVQAQLIGFRTPGPQEYAFPTCIGFPSFHVVWAVLCAHALWCFRWARIPAVVFSSLIIVSTLTTGWHYVADVIGGILVSAIAMWAAERIISPNQTRWQKHPPTGLPLQ